MPDLVEAIHRRYLDTLDDARWDDQGPRLDFGSVALPYFIEAFNQAWNEKHRTRLIAAVWQFRDPSALPTLGVALRDSSEDVWKESLDGIVTIGGDHAMAVLHDVRTELVAAGDQSEKIAWIDEAMDQVKDGVS